MEELLQDENLCLFFTSLCNVSKDYVVYLSETGNDDVSNEHCERAFAYELYRQWGNLLKERESAFVLNGEIGKLLSKFDESLSVTNNKEKYPDLVLHKGNGEFSGHEIICEIKRAYQINNLEGDLTKLKIFTNGERFYKWGILLIFGCKHQDNEGPILDFSIFNTQKIYRSIFSNSNGEIYEFNQGEIIIVSLEYGKDKNAIPEIRFNLLRNILNNEKYEALTLNCSLRPCS